jgi:flagellar biosynthesis/type III secretory pathway protein FliH
MTATPWSEPAVEGQTLSRPEVERASAGGWTQQAEQEQTTRQGESQVRSPREAEMLREIERLRRQVADLSAELARRDQASESLAGPAQHAPQASAVDPDSAPEAVPDDDRLVAELEGNLEEDRQAFQTSIEAVGDAIRGLQADQRGVADVVQSSAVELGVAIASRLLHQKIAANDFAVEEIVREVVKRLEMAESIVLRLHPDDLALLRRRLGDPPQLTDNGPEIAFVPDDTLQRGACHASAGDVSVASRLETQIADIRDHLLTAG